MASAPLQGDKNVMTGWHALSSEGRDRHGSTPFVPQGVPPAAGVVLVAGMAAAWFAAGSTGLVGHPLQRALTWLALATAVVAAWPARRRSVETWAVLTVGVVLGLFFTASTIPAVSVLAVAVVLAAIAHVSRGLTGRLALITAIGATVLGCFRFACASIPTVWLAADGLGWMLGRVAGWLAGSQLNVGATFGGIDFLVLMAAIYVAWIVFTVPPRRSRALWAAAAIVTGHVAYLIVLASSEKLLALLPDPVVPPVSDINNVGVWTWGNGLRTLLPWNVPLVALAIYGAIAAVMVRGAVWIPAVELDPKKLQRLKEQEEKQEVAGSALAADMLFRFGPALLAVVAVLLGALATGKSDLQGKKVVAYEKGYLNWQKPEYDSPIAGRYGMLQPFVESLGGTFARSKDLSKEELGTADVLFLIHPDEPWPKETLDRVWDYVRGGGSLLVAAEPAIRDGDSLSSFNDVLEPLAMRVRFDTAVTRSGNWEQSYDVSIHPAAAGIDDLRNRFGVQLGSSIRTCWPARPVLVGRWGWSDPGNDAVTTGGPIYDAGEPLGDLVLAAEQRLGAGRVFVLGDTTPLHNEMLPNSYPFVGRLLAYLAHRPSSPQAGWRQLLTLAALVAMVVLLTLRPAARQLMLTPAVMGVSLMCCTAAAYWSGRVLPDGRLSAPGRINNVACIDASHLEAFSGESSDLAMPFGIGELVRALMRQGYLPLLATDVTPERLQRCGLWISIGPSREFSPAERTAVHDFVRAGGTAICMVGAQDARPSEQLLADFHVKVPRSPVAPGDQSREPQPIGGGKLGRTPAGELRGPFYAVWPVESTEGECDTLVVWNEDESQWPLVLARTEGSGRFVVIGDTHAAGNENILFDQTASRQFWRWLLSRVVPGQKAWNPPSSAGGAAGDKDGSKEDLQ
jgi:hypothetical protein